MLSTYQDIPQSVSIHRGDVFPHPHLHPKPTSSAFLAYNLSCVSYQGYHHHSKPQARLLSLPNQELAHLALRVSAESSPSLGAAEQKTLGTEGRRSPVFKKKKKEKTPGTQTHLLTLQKSRPAPPQPHPQSYVRMTASQKIEIHLWERVIT